MNICKAIVQEGKNKGKQCTKKTNNEHGYCGRHLRNKEYNDGIERGIRWCRQFFRGCNTQITDKPLNVVTCDKCLESTRTKKKNCHHEGCKFRVKEKEIFCKKHTRDQYRLEEKEKGIKYCDIARGCFNICTDGLVTCKECLEKQREKDTLRVQEIKTMNKQLASLTDKRICQKCGKEYNKFNTHYNIESTKCKKCSEYQQLTENKRNRETRNYKEERKNNLHTYFGMHIRESTKRGYETLLTFDEYCDLVTKPCHYCNYNNEKEAIGIDRVNNSLHYTKENCVPCCKICNRIKHIYHPLFFIEKAKIISKTDEVSEDFYDKWQIYYTRSKNNQYALYKKDTEEKRGLKFLLTELEWDRLIRQPCYLCGYSQVEGIGLDRVDNTIREYNLGNSKPCCGSCNTMKYDMNYEDFIIHMKKIAEKWENTIEFDTIPLFDNPFRKNNTNPDQIPPKKPYKKWFSSSLYYAFLSNTEEEFINLNKEYITPNEVQNLKKEVLCLKDKQDILNRLSIYLATVRMRRERTKTTRKRWTSNSLYHAFMTNKEQEFINFNKDVIKPNEIEELRKEIMVLTDDNIVLERLSRYLHNLKMRRSRIKIKSKDQAIL